MRLIFLFPLIIAEIWGLSMISMFIPKVVDIRDSLQMLCNFRLSHGKLYSVKWYKDEFEFYRFMPGNTPPFLSFPLPGVQLDMSRSNMTFVTLYPLDFQSTGNYRCEISKDGPAFETIFRNENVTVAVFPLAEPAITGIQKDVVLGDYIVANCSSYKTNPAVELTWFVDGVQAESWQLEAYPPVLLEEKLEGVALYDTGLGIRFQLDKGKFEGKTEVQLRCSAQIHPDIPVWNAHRTLKIHPSPDSIHAQNRLNAANKPTITYAIACVLITIIIPLFPY